LKNVLHVLKDGGHSVRVGKLVFCLCIEIGLKQSEAEVIARASKFHDIGKVVIPNHILTSKEPLTTSERKLIEKHVMYGLSFVSLYQGEDIEVVKAIIASHHEHWDGNGYPFKLSGEDIPLCGRIVALCDVYDALCSKRPYKEPWKLDRVIPYLVERKGTQFDPSLVDPFFRVINQVEVI